MSKAGTLGSAGWRTACTLEQRARRIGVGSGVSIPTSDHLDGRKRKQTLRPVFGKRGGWKLEREGQE